MRGIIPALLLTAAGATNGCTYSQRVAYETSRRSPTRAPAIEVVESHNLTRPYKVIGMVTAESYYMQSALQSCRKEAAKMGATALLDFGPSGNRTGAGAILGGGMMMGSSYNTGFTAKAIVWQ